MQKILFNFSVILILYFSFLQAMKSVKRYISYTKYFCISFAESDLSLTYLRHKSTRILPTAVTTNLVKHENYLLAN